MNRRRLVAFAALALILLTPLIQVLFRGGGGEVVLSSTATVRPIRSSTLASGTFLYSDQVRLSPEVLGTVDAIYVEPGQRVRKDQPLVQINAATYTSDVAQRAAALAAQRASVQERAATLSNNRLKLRRLQQLQQRGFVTKSAVDDADESVATASAVLSAESAKVQQNQALLGLANQNLRKTRILAPVSGIVVAVSTRVGETVVPSSTNLAGSSLLTIAGTDAIVAEVNVDEADIGSVDVGQDVTLTATAFPGQSFKGTVSRVALMPGREDSRSLGVADQASSQARTYSVRVLMKGGSRPQIRAGMTCRVEIFSAAAAPSVTIPIEAIQTDEVGLGAAPRTGFVFVVRDGVALRKKVGLGVADDRYQSIVSGLRVGERIVAGPAKVLHNLSDGDHVRAK